MIEREVAVAARAQARRRGDLQPPQQGIPLGIDATIRYATGNWQEPLTRASWPIDSPYNTRTNAGLPPGPIGNPGPRLAGGGGEPRARRLPLLRGQARHLRRARLLRDRGGVRRDRGAHYQAALQAEGGRRPSAEPRRSLGGCRSSPSSATPSRTPARPRCTTRRSGSSASDDWRYEAIDVEPERFDAVVRALAGQGFAGANVTIPHKLRALEVADQRHRGGARDRRRQHAHLRRRRGRTPTTPTRTGFLTALPERARPAGARSCWAPAARPAPSSTRCATRAPRVSIWNRTPARAEELAAELGRRRYRQACEQTAASSSTIVVNATTVGLRRRIPLPVRR